MKPFSKAKPAYCTPKEYFQGSDLTKAYPLQLNDHISTLINPSNAVQVHSKTFHFPFQGLLLHVHGQSLFQGFRKECEGWKDSSGSEVLALEAELSHQNSSYKVKINQFSSDPVKWKAPSPPEKLMILNGCWKWV